MYVIVFLLFIILIEFKICKFNYKTKFNKTLYGLQKIPHSPRKLIKQSALESPEENKSSTFPSVRHSMNYGSDSQKNSNYIYNR